MVSFEMGYGMLLTSIQTDETAQHFYRKIGYKDCGALIMTIPGYEQPMEMFLEKAVKEKMYGRYHCSCDSGKKKTNGTSYHPVYEYYGADSNICMFGNLDLGID